MEIIRRGDDINGEDIPEWVLVELLLRLSSSKLICSFKLVSKQSLSIISDPLFIRTYVSQNSPRWTFISNIMHHKGSNHSPLSDNVVLDDVYSQVIKPGYCLLPLPYTQQQSDDRKAYIIEGVSNGLVLYSLTGLHSIDLVSYRFIHSYYICNPVTRSWIALPKITSQCISVGAGFLTHVEDFVLKNYTVVRLGIDKNMNLLRFQVFHSQTGEWENYNVEFGSIDGLFCVRKQAAEVNGLLHWITNKGYIIAYDPYKSPNEVTNIPLPVNHQTNSFGCLCAEYKGKLRFFTFYSTNISGEKLGCFEVWVLDDDHIWSQQYVVSEMDIHNDAKFPSTDYLVPLCFDPFDSDVVCMGSKDGLISYNIKTKRKQVIYQKCLRQNRRAQLGLEWYCAFLFVVPSWPISFP